MEYIKSKIRDINDFPQKGIVFKDLTTVFKDAKALHQIGEELAALYRDKGVTKVVGIESRGFIGGAIAASSLTPASCPCANPANSPPTLSRHPTTRSTARMLLKSTATPSVRTISW